MSLLQPEAYQHLVALLQGLQSSDNVARSNAETALTDEWVNPQPEMLLMGLAEQIQGGDDTVSLHEIIANLDPVRCLLSPRYRPDPLLPFFSAKWRHARAKIQPTIAQEDCSWQSRNKKDS